MLKSIIQENYSKSSTPKRLESVKSVRV